jgi:hypothetical protein
LQKLGFERYPLIIIKPSWHDDHAMTASMPSTSQTTKTMLWLDCNQQASMLPAGDHHGMIPYGNPYITRKRSIGMMAMAMAIAGNMLHA